MRKEEYLRLIEEDPYSFPSPEGSCPELGWVAEAWQHTEVRELFLGDLERGLSKTGELPTAEGVLPLLNQSLPPEELQELYINLRNQRLRPEREWRDQFAKLLPNSTPLPTTLEDEWEQAGSPRDLLQLCPETAFSDRKRRLFLVACCHRIWDILRDPRGQVVVAVAERYADGDATIEELAGAGNEVGEAFSEAGVTVEALLMDALQYLAADEITNVDSLASQFVDCVGARPQFQPLLELPYEERRTKWEEVMQLEAQEQADLFREIVGNPFSYDPAPLERDVLLGSALVAWQGGRLEQVAREIYDSRHFDRMPELAELLEAAGCPIPSLVQHCRYQAAHVHGCWVLDLLLGKR